MRVWSSAHIVQSIGPGHVGVRSHVAECGIRLAPAVGPLVVCLYVVRTTHFAVVHGVSAPGILPQQCYATPFVGHWPPVVLIVWCADEHAVLVGP